MPGRTDGRKGENGAVVSYQHYSITVLLSGVQ